MASLALAFDILARDKGASTAMDRVGDSADDLGDRLEGIGDKAKKGFAVAVGAGVAAGAALSKGFFDALDIGRGEDKLAAQLGLDPAQSAAFGKIAGDLYADAYGDSLGQVNEALSAVQSAGIEALGPDGQTGGLSAATAKALDLAAAFDLDVADAVNRAGVLLNEGLADDADQAFDLIVAAMQRMSPALRDELADATTEYGKFFADLGISGSEMLGLFAEADDVFTLDKTGDAIKELTIRATDMSTTSVDAFKAAGLNADRMAKKILAGGDEAREGFQEIVDGLLGIKDPVAQANAAIGLFGVPLEDLGVSEIPTFLRSLSDMGTGLGDVEGAADRMGDTLNDNAATKIEAFKRGALQGLTDFIGISVIPRAEELAAAFSEDGLAGAVDYLSGEFPALQAPLETLESILGSVAGFIDERVIPAGSRLVSWIQENQFVFDTLKVSIGVGLVTALGAYTVSAITAAAATVIAFAPFIAFAAGVGLLTVATDELIERFDLLPKASKGVQWVVDHVLVPMKNTLEASVQAMERLFELLGKVPDAASKVPIPFIPPGAGGALGGALGTIGNIGGTVLGLPFLDDGGIMPGPRGVHSLAWIAGGETVLPTHRVGSSDARLGSAMTNYFTIVAPDVENGMDAASKRLGRLALELAG